MSITRHLTSSVLPALLIMVLGPSAYANIAPDAVTSSHDRLQAVAIDSRQAKNVSKTIEDILDTDLTNHEDKALGQIKDIVKDKATNNVYAVVSVGGFAGLNEDEVVIPIDQIEFRDDKSVSKLGNRTALRARPAYVPEKYNPLSHKRYIDSLNEE